MNLNQMELCDVQDNDEDSYVKTFRVSGFRSYFYALWDPWNVAVETDELG